MRDNGARVWGPSYNRINFYWWGPRGPEGPQEFFPEWSGPRGPQGPETRALSSKKKSRACNCTSKIIAYNFESQQISKSCLKSQWWCFFQFVRIATFFSFLFSKKKDIHDNSASKKDYPENRKTTSLKRILVMTSAKNFSKAQKPKDIFKTTRSKKFQNENSKKSFIATNAKKCFIF